MQTRFTSEQLHDPETACSEAVIRKCVHCGFCTATCPTYVLLGDELDSPRGRIYLIKEMLENEQTPSREVVTHIDRCLSCLSCMTTCPSGVNYMHLIDHARAYVEDRYRRPLADRFLRSALAHILPYPNRVRVALTLGRFARRLEPALGRISPTQPLAAMLRLVPKRLRPAMQARNSRTPGERRGRVVVAQGCVENVLRPEIREATVRLLNRAGYDVDFTADEGCCGALTWHLGRTEDGLAAARRNVDAWTREIRRGLDAIVVTASGCGTTIKDYGHMLRDDPVYAEHAEAVSARARDITEFLEDVGLPAIVARAPMKVAYLSPCSMQHGQKIHRAPVTLLRMAGYEVVQPAEAHLCCGSAGSYNILQPALAAKLGERKARHLERLEADIIATGNIGCATQIGLYASGPIVHSIELLDWATGGPTPASLSDSPNGEAPCPQSP